MIWRWLKTDGQALCSCCGSHISPGEKRLGLKEKRTRWKIYCENCAGIAYKKEMCTRISLWSLWHSKVLVSVSTSESRIEERCKAMAEGGEG